MSTPLASVVLPVRNGVPWVRTAVESVLAQTETRWELVVVDDASTDGTSACLATLDDPRIRTLSLPEPSGPAVARNRGIEAARGPRVAFLDADDAFEPRKLQVQLSALEQEPGTGWSYTNVNRMDGEGRPLSAEGFGRWRPISGEILPELAALEAIVATPAVLVDRELLVRVGGFDETLSYCEDYDLWFRLAEQAPVVAVPEPLSRVRSHSEGYSRDRGAVQRSRVRVYDQLARRSREPTVGRIARREAARRSVSAAYRAWEAGRQGEAWKHWRDAVKRRAWSPRCWRFLVGAPFRSRPSRASE